jgi:hypothetical protein
VKKCLTAAHADDITKELSETPVVMASIKPSTTAFGFAVVFLILQLGKDIWRILARQPAHIPARVNNPSR